MSLIKILFLAVLIVLPGCGGAVGIVNSMSNTDAVAVETGLAYGQGPRQRYDVYRPVGAGTDAPVVVFLYGGAWSSGERGMYRFVGNALAEQGFVAVIPDYRLYPEVRFPDFVEDAAQAVAAIRRDVAGGRPVALVGHSAGAQIGALLAFDRRYLGGAACDTISGFIGIAGPYDFLPLTSERYRRIFPEATRDQSQPINFASGRAPATLLLHGSSDRTVEAEDSRILAQALRAAGNRAEVRIYDGVGHINIVGAIASPLRGQASTLADISNFVRERAGRPGC
ncbi:alpha/beta hydrolase [Mesorhizobium sp. YIM 152430]|uniref:alpha/beta hydrolase n=1 Tax=Mesorhizobium sp. YIM 152430 TaxID=3031761 RepID=UPI0023DA3E33|nr:alpha/beta hydrolase [Mesorhizobium sp. YIM 152430]MDF1601704.1 alpha/beta hydrolase [Mesorhizobium sp. YIM 152430]